MKKIYLLLSAVCLFALTACMDEHDEPTTGNYLVTSKSDIGDVTTTIAKLKSDYSSIFSQTNPTQDQMTAQKITEDCIFEGIVVANDEGGNLYQTILLRDIDETRDTSDPLRDQCIVLAIQSTYLAPYFPVGQKVKVNLKGLYIGCYSKVPKIGEPYFTSSGNLRLGPMLMTRCETNIYLEGAPDPSRPECTPLDCSPTWLQENKKPTDLYLHTPLFATVRGSIQQVQGSAKNTAEIMPANNDSYPYGGEYEPLPKIYAPKMLCDKGYGVDRTLINSENSTTATIRTSTQNDVAFMQIPEGECTYTGMLTYYSDWQMQVRSTSDIKRIIK